jgi:hypothetical protein
MIAFCWMDLTQSKLKRPQFVSFQGKMTTKLGEKEKYSHVPQQNFLEKEVPGSVIICLQKWHQTFKKRQTK